MSNETGFSNIKKQLFSFEGKLNRLEFLIRVVLLSGSFTALIMAMYTVSRSWNEVNFHLFPLCVVFIALVCIFYSFLYRRLADLKLQSRSRLIALIIMLPLIYNLFFILLEQLGVSLWQYWGILDGIGFLLIVISIIIFLLLFILKGVEGDNNEKV